LGRVWHSNYAAVDFIKNRNAVYGVKLTLDLKNAEKLAKDLRQCQKIAKDKGRDRADICAYWGKFRKGKGFKLEVKIHQP
jgi:hypothetical protein